jgi:hypothetical protein
MKLRWLVTGTGHCGTVPKFELQEMAVRYGYQV